MKFVSLLAALGALATVGQADLCTDSGNYVIASICVCKSGYSATDATTCTAISPNLCDAGHTGHGTIPVPVAETATTIANVQLADNGAATGDTLVQFTLKLPMTAGRKFSSIHVAPVGGTTVADTACNGNAIFASFAAAADTTSNGVGTVCADKWTIEAKFSDLLKCGFDTGLAGVTPTPGFERFDGIVRVAYTEPVVMSSGTDFAQTIERSSTIDFPVAVELDNQYSVTMSVNDVRVFAQQAVDFAISNAVISKDMTVAPKIDITYAIQYPYRISAFNEVTKGGNAVIDGVATLATSQCTYNAVADQSDYKTSGSRLNTCTKTGSYITFDLPSLSPDVKCQFTNDPYTLAFTVDCGTDVPAVDCPLLAPDSTGNSVTFTMNSENYCSALDNVNKIDNAITITEFKAMSLAGDGTNPTTGAKTAWRFNDYMLFRMKFSGLLLQSAKIIQLDRYFSTTQPAEGGVFPSSGTTTVATAAGGLTSTELPGYLASGTVNAAFLSDANIPNTGVQSIIGDLGLVTEGTTTKNQAFRFRVIANSNLLGTEPKRGETTYLMLKATIEVSYDRAGSAGELRRRRRQVAQGRQGIAVAEPQTIEAAEPAAGTAEAAPGNAAARAAPAVALVLALLSAVALL